MKSNIKRIVCLMLALAMVFAISGCGKKKNSSTPEFGDEEFDTGAGKSSGAASVGDIASTTVSADAVVGNADNLSWGELVAQMPASLKGKTVTMYSWNPAKHVTGAEKVIADFERQTGIKVEWKQGSYENYDTEIAALVNSGSSPDIIRYNSTNIYRMNLTQDVKSATGYDFSGAIWDQELIKDYTIKNKAYAVNLKNTFNQQPTVVYYSLKTIQRYKLQDPYELWKSNQWNFNKFLEMCKDFKEQTGRSGWMTNYQLDMLDWNGLDFIKFDGTKFIDNSSDAKILTTLQKICSYKETITCEAMREQDKIENGTYLFTTDNMLCARKTDFHYPTLKEEDDLYCVPFPTIPGQAAITPMHEYEAYGFPKGSKNGPCAYYFLRYYLNRDNYDAKTFFVNNQALETYDYVMKLPRFHKVSSSLCGVTCGDSNLNLDGWIRTVGKAEQIKSQLDSVKPEFARAVKAGNDTLAKFS